jgi:hypothetical protein
VALLPRETAAVPDVTGVPITSPNPADGTFEITGVPPGAYDLLARVPVAAYTGWGSGNPPANAANPWAFGRTPIEVRGTTIKDVAVVVTGGVDVTGKLFVDGQPAQANVRIGLAHAVSIMTIPDPQTQGTLNRITVYQPPINTDGSFAIPLVPEGAYRIQASIGGASPAAANAQSLPALPATAYVADVVQGTTNVYDKPFHVGRERVDPIQVLVKTDGGSIEGIVRDLDKKPFESATVVLVPALNRRQTSSLYKVVASDAQGRFVLNAVPPGPYKVFAWQNVPPGAWQNAEFLAQHEQRGVALTVNPGVQTSIETGIIRAEAPR